MNQNAASQIEPTYRQAFERWLDGRLTGAADEETELRIINQLIPLMESGQLIVDDRGRENQLTGGVVYDDHVIAAKLRRQEAAVQKSRRDKIVGAFLVIGALVVLLFVLGVFSSGGNKAETAGVAEETPEVAPTATPIRESVLEMADELGGRVQLGQPRTIEIRHKATEENVTLAIVPVEVDENGLIRYFAPDEEDAESVAVWVFGTVINYVFGIPEKLVQSLSPEDTIYMRTATGAVYAFTVTEQFTAEPQEVELFSQRRGPGLTLFALPSSTEPVPVARAVYLAANEEITRLEAVATVGEELNIGDVSFSVAKVTVNETLDGLLDVQVSGHMGANDTPNQSDPMLISLVSLTGQYAPATGNQLYAGPTAGVWQARWQLPPELLLGNTRLQVIPLYGGSTSVTLGRLPQPGEALQMTVVGADWDETAAEAVLTIRVRNSSEGTARLADAQFHLSQQGGDVSKTTDPILPILLDPGEQVALQLHFRPTMSGLPVLLQAGRSLWEIDHLPVPQPPG